MNLTGTNVFGGAAIFGIVAGFWNYIKIYGSKLLSLFIVRIEIHAQARNAVSRLLQKEFNCSPLGKKFYTAHHEYIRPLKRNQIVAFERIPSEPTIWWRNKKPLIVSGIDNLSITFIRGFYDRDKLVAEAINKFNDEQSNKNWKNGDRFFIRKKYGTIGSKEKNNGNISKGQGSLDVTAEAPIGGYDDSSDKLTARPISWKREELGQPTNKSAMNKLSLSQQSLNAFQEALLWRDSEEWFKERSIPWKRGWLLHGGVGTGKTAFTRCLAQELNVPIISFDLASMTNKDFSDAWNDIMGWAPCIALFEDIDSVFNGRKNVAVTGMENGLSFDSFLNCLDGVENTDGVFVVVTTNDVSKLDPAIGNPINGDGMSTRPGRIDRAIEFHNLDEKGRIKMAERIMQGIPKEKWEHLLDCKDDSGAQFQERCCRLALKLFWENK